MVSSSQMNAVLTAEKLGSAVQHPIIEAIRHCSTMPDAAVDFFVKLLHPTPAARMTMAEAACHPYLARAMQWLLTKQAHVSGAACEQAYYCASSYVLAVLTPTFLQCISGAVQEHTFQVRRVLLAHLAPLCMSVELVLAFHLHAVYAHGANKTSQDITMHAPTRTTHFVCIFSPHLYA